MKKKLLILCLTSLILGVSCSDEDETRQIFVKLENSSSYDYNEISLKMKEDNIYNYQLLKSNESSDYKKFDFASNMPSLSVNIYGQSLKARYYDRLGYSELKDGYYTFKISVLSNNPDVLNDPDVLILGFEIKND